MLTLQVPADSRFVTTVRALATTLLESVGVLPDDVYDVNLVLGEVCSNVVRHAYSDPTQTYEVALRFIPTGLAITVTDHGRGIDPAARRPPDPNRPSGWGLWLVEHLCDRVTTEPVDPTGTRVTAQIPLRYHSASDQRQNGVTHEAAGSGPAPTHEEVSPPVAAG